MPPTPRTYRLIDADTHVNEPADLWQSRVAAKHRARAPRVERLPEGDAWILDGTPDPINFGLNATAGMDPSMMKPWVRFEDIRKGGWDPKVRLEEMDQDGIDAAVLYPTPRLSHGVIANRDPELHLELVRAYNDWLSEYVAHDPARLGGMLLLPNRGVAQAIEELERVAGRPGIKGALLGCYPHGSLEYAREDDALFERVAAARLALHIHVSLVDQQPTRHKAVLPGCVRFFDVPERVLQLVFSGVFDRIPELRVAIVEADCGWVPYFKEQVADKFRRRGLQGGSGLERPPIEYIEEHFYWTYVTDAFGVRNRHAVGLERMMWSSDYPHIPADWPNSYRTINAAMSGVPREERALLLAGNAQRLYRFGE